MTTEEMKIVWLNKQETYNAIREGVKDAYMEILGLETGYCEENRKEYLDAFKKSVRAAFWELFTNATDMPCSDFYATIKAAVKEAHAEALE